MNAAAWERLQRVADLGGRYVGYVDQGSGPAEPVVLLHGMPTWGYVWHPLAAALSRTRRVLVPDLLGFGHSDKRDGFDRSLPRQAEAIERLLQHLGIERAALVGHDIGGGAALQLAARSPGRVSRLCLVNSVCYDSWPVAPLLELGHPRVVRATSARTVVRLLGPVLRRGFAARPSSDLVADLLAPYATEVGKRSLVRNAAALDTNHTTELAAALPRLTQPVLLLWGEDDRFQPVRYAERLRFDLPRARLVRLGGARHFVMLERAPEVAAELIGFLDEARPAAAPEAAVTP